MSYSQFSTLRKATSAFGLTLQERAFLPVIPGIPPSQGLVDFLKETLPSAASGSEKLRSEAIIYSIGRFLSFQEKILRSMNRRGSMALLIF
jgi:hypothetical protein